ncbi:MAG: cation diffusion facilitator family transporter [Prosthecobacter sp.]|uniref:cation diffusion facilitator family transporter n=1 Tax=Prosthecobacter sp. TaxID=1965333 RepID=UPI003BAE2D23
MPDEPAIPVSGTGSSLDRGKLRKVFALTFSYFIVEVIGGLVTGSLALLADAAHMLTDVGGLALALFASWMSSKPATPARTYGYYRVEIFAALINAVVLFGISFWILYEAWQRFRDPPAVSSLPMLAVAAVGLVINILGMRMLKKGSEESLNMRGAYFEVVSDLLGSIGVIVAGVIMLTTGWYYADPVFSVVIGLFILPRTWKLMFEAVDILLEATPARINLAEVEKALLVSGGVTAVHDLHVWTITSGMDAVSAHLVLVPGATLETGWELVQTIRERLRKDFDIAHATLQLEPPGVMPEQYFI